MTEQAQIKALAELDGWTLEKNLEEQSENGFFWKLISPCKELWLEFGWPKKETPTLDCQVSALPAYLTSYDAIIPLIQKQPLEIRDRIATKGGPISFMVTPAQLAEKLLRAIGKWTE